jgi:hypothetical protein
MMAISMTVHPDRVCGARRKFLALCHRRLPINELILEIWKSVFSQIDTAELCDKVSAILKGRIPTVGVGNCCLAGKG